MSSPPDTLIRNINITYTLLMSDIYLLHNVNVDVDEIGPYKTFMYLGM